MAKFVWQDGTLVSKAKVEINGTIYEVDPEEYSGSTPLSASNLNAMVDSTYSDLKDYVDGTVLYEGNTTSNFTLTDDVENYRYIEFYYNKGYAANSTKVEVSAGKAFLFCGFVNNTSFAQISIRNVTFSGTNVTNQYSGGINLETNGNSIYTTNEISISKVIGYK